MEKMYMAIRADGSHTIGLGHLYRSSIVAEEALKHGHAVTVVTQTPEAAREIMSAGVNIEPLPDEGELAAMTEWIAATDADVVVTDSNKINTTYQRQLSDTDAIVAVIVDDSRHQIHADIVFNGNLYAENLTYEWSGTEPEWCLGTEYLLLREPFRTYAAETQPFPETVSDVLVTMGGVDKENRTPTVLSALDTLEYDITAIIGPGFRNSKKIRDTASNLDCQVNVCEDPPNLPELFLNSDLAVCTLGTTTYELLATQTPIVGIPDNETPIDEALNAANAAIIVDRYPSVDEIEQAVEQVASEKKLRRSLWRAGKSVISGSGPQNVVEVVERMVFNHS